MTVQLVIVLILSFSTVCRLECPGLHWLPMNGVCYYVSPSEMTWADGADFCRSIGAHLFQQKTDTEFDNTMSLMAQYDFKNLWMGLDDIQTEGLFTWQDGTQLLANEERWNTGNPDNYLNEDCVEVWLDIRKWNDRNCLRKTPIICQTAETESIQYEFILVPFDTRSDEVSVHLELQSFDSSSNAVKLVVKMRSRQMMEIFNDISKVTYDFTLFKDELPKLGQINQSAIYISIEGVNHVSKVTLKARFNDMASILLHPIQSTDNYYKVITYCQILGSCIIGLAGELGQSDNIVLTLPSLSATSKVRFNGDEYGSGQTLDIHINEYEVVWIECDRCDLTNTIIQSTRNLAVFSGGVDTVVRKGIFESTFITQVLPVNAWGKEFVLINSGVDSGGDIYKMISRYDTTKVSIDGSSTIQIKHTGQVLQRLLSYGDVVYIKADKPIMISQIMYTGDNHAAMVMVPPTEQYENLTMYLPCIGNTQVVIDINYQNIQNLNKTIVSNSGFSIFPLNQTSSENLDSCTINADGYKFGFLRNALREPNYIDVLYVHGYTLKRIPVSSTKEMYPGDLVDNDGDGEIDEDDCSSITDSFELKSGEKKFSDAVNSCSGRNMMLAKLDTKERNEKALDYFRKQGMLSLQYPILIGLSDATGGGSYRWSDGDPVTFSAWKSESSSERCVTIDASDLSSSLTWQRSSCDEKFAYLCTQWADFSGKDCQSRFSVAPDNKGTSFIFPVWGVSSSIGTVDVDIAVHTSSIVTLFSYAQGELSTVEYIDGQTPFTRSYDSVDVNLFNRTAVFRIDSEGGECSVHMLLQNRYKQMKSMSTILFPTDTWGLEYYAASYQASDIASFCVVTPLYEHTSVYFLLKNKEITVNVSYAGETEIIENKSTFKVDVTKFNFVHIKSYQDLTGTYIRGNNPISVICGAEEQRFVLGEQLLPVKYYRSMRYLNVYLVYPTDQTDNNVDSYVRILTSQRHTTCRIVTSSGTNVEQLANRGDFVELKRDFNAEIYTISCSNPVFVWSISIIGNVTGIMTLVPTYHHYSYSQQFMTFRATNNIIQKLYLHKTSSTFPLLYLSTRFTGTTGFVTDLQNDTPYTFTTTHNNITFFQWSIGVSNYRGFGTQVEMRLTGEWICELQSTPDEDCDGQNDEEHCTLLGYNFLPEKYLLAPGKYLPDNDNDGNYDEDCSIIIPDCGVPKKTNTAIGEFVDGSPTHVTLSYGSLSCANGYSKVNTSVEEIECHADGKWMPEIVCLKDCLDPTIDYADSEIVIDSDRRVGSNVTMRCDNGLLMIGENVLFCTENSTWTSNQFICVEACRDPRPDIPHSFIPNYIEGTIFYPNTTIEIECNSSTTMIGDRTMLCTPEGEWDHLVQCIPDCADPRVEVEVENATLLGFSLGSSSAYNTTYRFRCNLKFRMIGEGSITCHKNSSWSIPQFYCKPCKCSCRRVGKSKYLSVTPENIKLIQSETAAELSVDEKALSKYKFTKECAPNKKKQEKSIGYGGAVVLVGVFAFIILIDIPTLVAHVKHLLRIRSRRIKQK